MRRIKKQRCEVCNKTDCPGWQEGQPVHGYRGKGSWFFGCHCDGCSRARNESGGFIGALVDHLSAPASQPASQTHTPAMDDEDRTPVPEGYDVAAWRKADEVYHAMALVADDTECVKIIYAAIAAAEARS